MGSLIKLQGNKLKYYTNPNNTPLYCRKMCCQFLNLSARATQFNAQGVH